MPAKKRSETTVSCPHCGHRQQEAKVAYSTVCRKCRQHFRLEDVLNPRSPDQGPKPRVRQIVCFDCSTPLEVPEAASSTMCKRCSSHIDLQDYSISGTVSKNFRTTGNFVIEEKGYVLNSDTVAVDVVIKGRFIGKLRAARLTIYNSATIKGTFETEHLVIPPGNHFRWSDPVTAATTEVQGELVADVKAAKALIVRAGARFFGNVTAKNLIVESGAVFVGEVNIGTPATEAPSPAPSLPPVKSPTPVPARPSALKRPHAPRPKAKKRSSPAKPPKA